MLSKTSWILSKSFEGASHVRLHRQTLPRSSEGASHVRLHRQTLPRSSEIIYRSVLPLNKSHMSAESGGYCVSIGVCVCNGVNVAAEAESGGHCVGVSVGLGVIIAAGAESGGYCASASIGVCVNVVARVGLAAATPVPNASSQVLSATAKRLSLNSTPLLSETK